MEQRTLAEIEKDIAHIKEELANVRGTETEVYARIVGYYRSVRNWNKGKRDEYNHRKLFVEGENAGSSAYTLTNADTSCACSTPEVVTHVEKIATGDTTAVRYEMFARATCPNCPPVKAYLAETAIPGIIIDADTEAGAVKASEMNVFSAPTVIFYDVNDVAIARALNVTELREVLEPTAVIA